MNDKSTAAALDRVAFGCLWAFVMALPWEGHLEIGGLALTHWIGFLAFGVAGLRLFATRQVRRATAIHVFMALFVLWVCLSLIWTADQDMTLSRIGSYIQLLLMVWLIWDMARSDTRIAALLYAYCVGTCVSSLETIHNLMVGMTEDTDQAMHLTEYGRYAPKGFDQNELALLLALGIPMSFYLLSRIRSGKLASLCWVQIVLSTTAILLTGSRAGLLALAAACLIVPFTVPHLPGWRRPFCLLVLAAAAAVAVLLVPAATWSRLLTIESEVGGGDLDHRTVIWAAGGQIFRHHPFIGVGAGAYGPSVVSKIDIVYVAHNSFLSVLVELGVVGALIFIGLLAGLFYVAWHMRQREKWLWTVELLTWVVGVSSLTWEYRKITWFLFAMVAAHGALVVKQRAQRGATVFSRRAGRPEPNPFSHAWPSAGAAG